MVYLKFKIIRYSNRSFHMRKMIISISILLLFGLQPLIAQENFYSDLSDASLELTEQKVEYDPAYFNLNYPNGDIPAGKGACTDVVIRAYRKLGIDLQKEVHEDMKANFNLYPKNWGLKNTDTNIDHRRVPNLMVFFSRHGIEKPVTADPSNYLPGDIVCWNLRGGISHIGFVVNKKSENRERHLIVHNIGAGQMLADCLFDFKIIGHYCYQK